MEKKGRGLGILYTFPFKGLNLPFKTYRQYAGTPKKGETYTATLAQKQRVKKLVPLVLGGLKIEEKDKKFLDLFNDFLTSENQPPIDQSDMALKCDDCVPYLYKGSSGYTPPKGKEKKEEEKINSTESIPLGVYKIKFNKFLKLTGTSKKFDSQGFYWMRLINKNYTRDGLELYFTNTPLSEEDFVLIFTTRIKNPIGKVVDYRIYQDNTERPFKRPFFLGEMSVKISEK